MLAGKGRSAEITRDGQRELDRRLADFRECLLTAATRDGPATKRAIRAADQKCRVNDRLLSSRAINYRHFASKFAFIGSHVSRKGIVGFASTGALVLADPNVSPGVNVAKWFLFAAALSGVYKKGKKASPGAGASKEKT